MVLLLGVVIASETSKTKDVIEELNKIILQEIQNEKESRKKSIQDDIKSDIRTVESLDTEVKHFKDESNLLQKKNVAESKKKELPNKDIRNALLKRYITNELFNKLFGVRLSYYSKPRTSLHDDNVKENNEFKKCPTEQISPHGHKNCKRNAPNNDLLVLVEIWHDVELGCLVP